MGAGVWIDGALATAEEIEQLREELKRTDGSTPVTLELHHALHTTRIHGTLDQIREKLKDMGRFRKRA